MHKIKNNRKKMMIMKELKPIDYKLLFELMKDSHRSDRQLAKALGVSQPTVTRRRAMLEENYIDGYTIIPRFSQIGLQIGALTLIKSKLKSLTGQRKEEAIKNMKEWYMKQTCVAAVVDGRGLGYDLVCASLHETFLNYTEFIKAQDAELSDWVVETQTFTSELKSILVLKPFHLKLFTSPK